MEGGGAAVVFVCKAEDGVQADLVGTPRRSACCPVSCVLPPSPLLVLALDHEEKTGTRAMEVRIDALTMITMTRRT